MPKGYNHVTRDLRCQIYALKARGDSLHSAILGEQLSGGQTTKTTLNSP